MALRGQHFPSLLTRSARRVRRLITTNKTMLLRVAVVLAFAVIGYLALSFSHAATIALVQEAENGTLAGGATTISDSNASNGQAVQFGSSSSSNTGFGGGSKMVLGLNMNGITGPSDATDMAGAVKYVRVDMSWGGTAPGYTAAGLKVDALLQGAYSTSGISGLGSATTWANNQLNAYKADGCTPTLCPMIEVLNEPGGHWFWGNNAMTEPNAAAYDSILIATYNAFNSAYGSSRPKILASFDGGMSDGSGGWGQYMWQANASIGNYIDGITVHPYNMTSTGLGSQSNVTNSYASAQSLSGRSIPVYITEVGWQTATAAADNGDPPQSGTVLLTPTQQCSNVYNFVSWARGLGYVNAVLFFDYRDDNASQGDGTYGMEYGNGSHKPAYNALVSAGNGSANPC